LRLTRQCAASKRSTCGEKDFDTEKRVVHIRASKNETSKRVIPLNDSAFDAVQRMVERAETLGHSEPHTNCATFEEYPPSQKVGSFSLDQVLEKLQQSGSSGK
jgi:hypothetical protein